MALLSVSSLSLPLDASLSKHAFWYALGVLFIWSFHIEKNAPLPAHARVVTSQISHHSDTFSNLTCDSTGRTVMASDMLAGWRVKKNGSSDSRGRSRTQRGRPTLVISECSRQMVWVQEIQFNKNLLSTYYVSGSGMCHWPTQYFLLPGAYEVTPALCALHDVAGHIRWNHEAWWGGLLRVKLTPSL